MLKHITEYPLKHIPISMLHFDSSNPNQMSHEQMHGLRRSMERWGYLTPIVVDEDYQIADGEHRALIYKEFKLDKIPAYVIPLKDDSERRLLRQMMNKLRGEHDPKLDADELALLFQNNKLPELATLIAQQQDDILQQLQKYKPEIIQAYQQPEDFDVEQAIQQAEEKPAITKTGDLYILGDHKLLCADATDRRNIDRLMDGSSSRAQLALLDPPYGVDYSGATEEELDYVNDSKDARKYQAFITNLLAGVNSVLDTNCTLYLFHSHTQQQVILKALDDVGYKVRAQCIWVKNNATGHGYLYRMNLMHYRQQHEPIYYCQRKADKFTEINWYADQPETTIWQYDRLAANREHPTTKPPELYQKPIKNSSKEGDIILDPTLGSGSTLIACEQIGRQCYGMEIDPHYVDVICRRWEAYTGRKAELLA